MTAQRAVVGKDDVIAHGAIVPNMAVSEKVPVITDVCFAFTRGTAMDCHEFAKCVFVANF